MKKNSELIQSSNTNNITTNNNITNSHNTINNTTNITNNIQLNNYGDENIDHITDQVLDRLMHSPGVMIARLFKRIHYSRKHPENKNIKITNRKDKYIHIHKNGDWIFAIRKHIIDQIISKHFGTLEAHYEEHKAAKMDYIYQGRFNRYAKRIEEADKETINKIVEDITLLILNHSQ